jgi:Ca2+/Na+ antiporter
MAQTPGQPQQPNHQQEESIFDEAEILGTKYDKHVKRARNVLFILATLFVVYGLLFIIRPKSMDDIVFCIGLLIMAAIFVGLGIWSKKNPVNSILIGLIIYLVYNAATAFLSWQLFMGGMIFKIVLVLYLITGLKNAQEAKSIKDALGKK